MSHGLRSWVNFWVLDQFLGLILNIKKNKRGKGKIFRRRREDFLAVGSWVLGAGFLLPEENYFAARVFRITARIAMMPPYSHCFA